MRRGGGTGGEGVVPTGSGAPTGSGVPTGEDSAEELDLTGVSAAELRDRLSAFSDGRDVRVVRAAVDLRESLDRLAAAVTERRAALAGRAGEIARAAAPFAGGAVVAGVGAVLVARRVRRPQGPARRGTRRLSHSSWSPGPTEPIRASRRACPTRL